MEKISTPLVDYLESPPPPISSLVKRWNSAPVVRILANNQHGNRQMPDIPAQQIWLPSAPLISDFLHEMTSGPYMQLWWCWCYLDTRWTERPDGHEWIISASSCAHWRMSNISDNPMSSTEVEVIVVIFCLRDFHTNCTQFTHRLTIPPVWLFLSSCIV